VRGSADDFESVFVDVFVAFGAEGYEVVADGEAADGIVDDVVDVEPERVWAAGDAAAIAVASEDFAALCFGGNAGFGIDDGNFWIIWTWLGFGR
jgi:hypothetical protein